jgi:hypothetical protein
VSGALPDTAFSVGEGQAFGRRPWLAELVLRLRRLRDRLLMGTPFRGLRVRRRAGAPTGHLVATEFSTVVGWIPPRGRSSHTTNTAWRLAANWFKSW